MKIVVLDTLTLGGADLGGLAEFGELVLYDTTSLDERIDRCKDAQIIITNKVLIDKELLDNTPFLKLVCITATGMNNVDLEYAKQKGVVVKNAAGYSTQSVTQLTFAMLFYLVNHMNYYVDYGLNRWVDAPTFTNLSKPFWEISGKRWGIIGLGEIGKNVARAASGFGCEVVYFSTSGANNHDTYKRLELEELLQSCDIISIHAPLNAHTKDLINKTNLPLLKDKAILLNLGRGGIVNEMDICSEIDIKEIYFGTDVLESEPMKADSPYRLVQQTHRLCITPHIAWGSIEAREKLVAITQENIKEFLS